MRQTKRGIQFMLIGMLVLIQLLLLSGCGKEEPKDVQQRLSERLASLNGYEAEGTMTIFQNKQPANYHVRVMYQKPHYYRIELSSADHRMRQEVYRNDDGVYLVTPHIGKTFRFQSEWPGPHGQVYLYQTLIKAIMQDDKRQMQRSEDGNQLLFQVKAVYPHRMFTSQKIWLDQRSLAPQKVEVHDEQANVRVAVVFKSFQETNATNLKAFQLPKTTEQPDPKRRDTASHSLPSFAQPHYLPAGVEKYDEQSTILAGRPSILQRFDGNYQFSIWTTPSNQRTSKQWAATLIDLGGSYGLMNSPNQIVWWNGDLEYRLHSDALPISEMIRVAESTQVNSQKP